MSPRLPVDACNKYYGIGLVVMKTRVRENGKARLYCLQCGLNGNKRVLQPSHASICLCFVIKAMENFQRCGDAL